MKKIKPEEYLTVEEAYETGRRNGQGHSVPSPETRKMVGDLDKKLEVYCTKMEDLKETVVNGFAEIKQSIKDLSATKANKWTEKVLIGLGSAMGLGFLSILGWLIVEAIRRFR